MRVHVRFAPSPTGYLHVGNIRTALVNWLFARKQGGQFILRLDDTDTERSKPEYEAAIQEDLTWLGLGWDRFERQADRMGRYDEAKQKLIASGRLYACYETQEELDIRRKMQAGRGLPPIYDRAALKLSEAEREKFVQSGRRPHYRFLLNDADVVWQDMIRGEVRFTSGHLSDPVLVREDGVPLYTLASVVDDGDMAITHILRGEDHVSNTAVQMQIFEALGISPPEFGHLALIKTKEGELSKRSGGGDIRTLRELGLEPMAINSLLAKIGTSDPIEAVPDLKTLAVQFDIQKFGRAPAMYDPAELERLNEKLVHQLSYADVKDRLPAGIAETFWNSIRANLKKVSDAGEWWHILHEFRGAANEDVDKEFLLHASALLPPEPWDQTTWDVWVKHISEKTGRKGRLLFMPIRKALTGMEHGPELKRLLPLLNEKIVRERLAG